MKICVVEGKLKQGNREKNKRKIIWVFTLSIANSVFGVIKYDLEKRIQVKYM